MQDLLPPPPTISDLAKPVLEPSFMRALRGSWLLTWKSRLTWRRLSVLALLLLILPSLIYVTTASRHGWVRRQSWLGNPLLDFSAFNARLARGSQALTPELAAQLNRIFTEEYARGEQSLGDIHAGQGAMQRRGAEIRSTYDRIRERARPLLAQPQLRHLNTIEEQKLLALERSRGPVFWSRTTPFHRWLIDFYFFVILPVICIAGCGSLIREEVQANTLGFLTTRPLTRARLVLVKFISQTAWLQLLLLVQALLLFAAAALRQVPGLGSLLPLFLATQFLAVLAWSALGAFLGLITKKFMALALLYGFVVEMGIGRIPTNINSLSLTRHLKSLLSHSSTLQEIFDWPSRGVPFSITALMIATTVFLSLALLLFTFQEYHHTTEMQK
jgi:hypothetical protein